jgi:hypothetical protein
VLRQAQHCERREGAAARLRGRWAGGAANVASWLTAAAAVADHRLPVGMCRGCGPRPAAGTCLTSFTILMGRQAHVHYGQQGLKFLALLPAPFSAAPRGASRSCSAIANARCSPGVCESGETAEVRCSQAPRRCPCARPCAARLGARVVVLSRTAAGSFGCFSLPASFPQPQQKYGGMPHGQTPR